MEILDKRLINGTPGKGTREEGGPFVILGKARAAIRTDTCREEVFVEECVVLLSRKDSLFLRSIRPVDKPLRKKTQKLLFSMAKLT